MLQSLQSRPLLIAKKMDFILLSGVMVLYLSRRASSIAVPPVAQRRAATVLIGVVYGESRGVSAMDPPIEHGDDLLWLRDDTRENAEVLAHLRAENAFTKMATAPLAAACDALYTELRGRLKETDEEIPVADGPFEYYTKTAAGAAYVVHARRPRGSGSALLRGEELSEEGEEVVLDENQLASGHDFCSVGAVEASPSHKIVTYAVDFEGDETYRLHFKAMRGCGISPPDVIEGSNGDVEWGSEVSIYYLTMDGVHRPYKLWCHVLGEPQSEDRLLFEENDERFWLGIDKSRSGAFILLSSVSKRTSEVHAIPLVGDPLTRGVLNCIAPRREGVLYQVDHVSDSPDAVSNWSATAPPPSGVFAVLTNADKAKNFKLAVAPLTGGPWIDVVPESDALYLESIDAFAGALVIQGRAGGVPQIWLLPRASLLFPSQQSSNVILARLPTPAAVYSLSIKSTPEWGAAALRFRYAAPCTPDCVAEVNFEKAFGEDALRDEAGVAAWRIVAGTSLYDALRVVPVAATRLLKQRQVPNVDPSNYATLRIEAVASDGSRIPISLVYRPSAHGMAPPLGAALGASWIGSGAAAEAGKSCPLPCPASLVLYGYGSYGASMDKGFSTATLALADRGVVYAIAHVRGGGEMGRSWYEDGGRCHTKKNTFSDFIACAEHLIASGWTEKGRVACWGASAGGLLVGAVLNARPDLWAAALSDVGFVDVIESVADPSIPLAVTEWEEWGNPNVREAYDYIKSYSPLDNLVKGARYPPILLTGGLNDSRVAYWEPAKFAQRLRAATSGDPAVILLKTDMGAGHFSYVDRYVELRDTAFQLAWLINALK